MTPSSRVVMSLLLLACTAAPAAAQQTSLPAPAAPADSMVQAAGSHWNTIRIAKWSLAGAAAGTAIYGFISNQRADDRYEQLEQTCQLEPDRCLDTLPDGAYADPQLEAQYQEIRSIDRRARTALVAGQIGVAASVVLFILDLRDDAPANIPYDPRTFDVGRAPDGGLSLRVNLPIGK